jgi:hypothetical protein
MQLHELFQLHPFFVSSYLPFPVCKGTDKPLQFKIPGKDAGLILSKLTVLVTRDLLLLKLKGEFR